MKSNSKKEEYKQFLKDLESNLNKSILECRQRDIIAWTEEQEKMNKGKKTQHEFDVELFCPHCGTQIINTESMEVLPCPHLVFIYGSGDPDIFDYMRPDYAANFLSQIKQSESYLEYIKDDGEPINKTEEEMIMSGKILRDLLSEETQQKITLDRYSYDTQTDIYKCGGYYSSLHIGIDLGMVDG